METILSFLNNPSVQQDWVPVAVLIAGYVFICAVWRIAARAREVWK